MYTIKDLNNEISAVVDNWNGCGELMKSWVVNSVMMSHANVSGDDADMALCCMNETVGNCVNAYFRKRKAIEYDSPQLVLDGYERLQREYVFDRGDGEQVIVSVHEASDVDLLEKAEEHRRAGDGHYKHADELERYVKERRKAV